MFLICYKYILKNIMNVYFLRHGFALHNQEYIKRGESAFFDITTIDSELVDLGKEQAKKAGVILKDINFDFILCSPLIRCIQTANLTVPNKKVILDDLLLEPQGLHICNKRKDKDILENILKNFNNDFDLTNVKNNYEFNKENESEIKNRTNLLLNKINDLKKNGALNILIVSHHDFINKFFKYNLNQKCHLKNCEIKKIFI